MKQITEYISENRVLVTHKKLNYPHIANILITLLKRNNPNCSSRKAKPQIQADHTSIKAHNRCTTAH